MIVDFSAAAGETVELRSTKRHGGRNVAGSHSYAGALMQFRVDPGRVADRTRVPRRLRPLPGWERPPTPRASPTTPGRSRSAASSRPPG